VTTVSEKGTTRPGAGVTGSGVKHASTLSDIRLTITRSIMPGPKSDSQFLFDIAHTVEIGDQVEERDVDRLRDIARSLEGKEEGLPDGMA
jgi:hypothetical protein